MQSNFWTRAKEILSNVSIKTYLYALLTIGVLVAIIISVSSPSKYGKVKKDGKFYLNIEQIAADYNLDLSAESDENIDYTNRSDRNLTSDLTQSLILTNMFLDQNGITDSEVKGKILSNVILDYQKRSAGKVYVESDLNIVRNEDKSSVQEYFNDLSRAFKSYDTNIKNIKTVSISDTPNPTETTLVNTKSIISSNILKLIDANDKFINDMIGIPATRNGSVYQLQLLNLISQQNAYLKSLAYIETDPAKYIMVDGESFLSKFESDISSINEMFASYFRSFNIQIN